MSHRITTSRWLAPVASILALGALAAPASADVARTQLKITKMIASVATPTELGLTGGCAVQEASQVFLPWADLSYYTLAPNGDFESGATGWTLGSGAALVSQNSDFSTGSQALSLGGTGTAVTPSFCVDVTQPTVRFFVKNTGPAVATLNVDALFTDLTGKPRSLQIAKLTAGPSWAPSAIVPLIVNQLATVSPTGATSIQLRFTAASGHGSWVIDDLQIDPFRPR
jgi:hypothetical protein